MVYPRLENNWPQLSTARRNRQRLKDIIEARLDRILELRVIDTEWKRNLLLFSTWAKQSPVIGQLVRGILYDNQKFFEVVYLHSADTILRDNRYLETGDPEVGFEPFFERPPKLCPACKRESMTYTVKQFNGKLTGLWSCQNCPYYHIDKAAATT